MPFPHYTNREHDNLSLVLCYGPLGLVRATDTCIAQDSICVDTGCIALNDDSEVEIVLSIRKGDTAETHRIRAEVSGHDEHGFRLRFRECAKATLEALLPFVTRH